MIRTTVTASRLRENVYKILDQVLETGVPVEIVRGGRKLEIAPVDTPPKGKLDRLKGHPDALASDPEELVRRDWSRDWRP